MVFGFNRRAYFISDSINIQLKSSFRSIYSTKGMSELQFESGQQPTEYAQITKVLEQYKKVIEEKFQSNEISLLKQLEAKTIKLKQSILFFKKQTSSENIEDLVAKKRHEKENERLQLQVQWRNLTQKYKKLQQEQKKINEQNKQNEFDIKNLQKKIAQLQEANKFMIEKNQNLKNALKQPQFITQIQSNYVSPYKFKPILQQTNQTFKVKASKTKKNFRLKIQNKKKTFPFEIQNHRISLNKINFLDAFEAKKQNFVLKNESVMSLLDINKHYHYEQPINIENGRGKLSFNKSEKWNELMKYLGQPEIKDKIFDLLLKQFQKH